MRKLVIGLGVVVAVVAIGLGIAYLAAGGGGGRPPVVAQNPPPDDSTSHQTHASPEPVQTQVMPTAMTQVTTGMQPRPDLVQTSSVALATNATDTQTNWEDQIDEIVGSEDADTNKVKQLLSLFPKLPPDGQEEAVQHLSNLVDDDAYQPLGDMLKNDKLSEGVLDQLLADLLNRPNNLKLPLLLDVASDSNHAKHDEAKDLLELYLGEEIPTTSSSTETEPVYDWSKTGPMVTNWLQQNPD